MECRASSVSDHQGRYEMWKIVNSLLHEDRIGCQLELPYDVPPRDAAMYHFTRQPGAEAIPSRIAPMRGQLRRDHASAPVPVPTESLARPGVRQLTAQSCYLGQGSSEFTSPNPSEFTNSRETRSRSRVTSTPAWSLSSPVSTSR